MTIGFTQPGTGFGTRDRMIGSRKTVPPRMFRIFHTELSIRERFPKRKGTYSTVGALPHLFQVELFHSGLIGCNGCTFNSDLVFNDRVSRVNSDLIICL